MNRSTLGAGSKMMHFGYLGDATVGERVNVGAVIFAATVLAFYFSQVMDKLGRSVSLIGLGVLFLIGGWALERVRRQLVHQARGDA